MPMRAENELVLVGVEDTYGAGATLTGAANTIQCDMELVPIEAKQIERKISRPYFGATAVINGQVHRSVKLTNIELAGSGDAAVAPPWTPILRGCGWAAVTGPTSTIFTPVTNATDSLAISPIIDLDEFKLNGARGSVSFLFEIAEVPKLEAAFKGLWVVESTLDAPVVTNYNAWKIPQPLSCTNTSALAFNGKMYPFYSLRIDQGAGVEFYCVPGATGQRVEIMKRLIKGTVKLQAKHISEHNLFAIVRANTRWLTTMTHGSSAGNRIGFAAPKVQFLNPRPADYLGELAWELDLLFTPDAGDDEIVWTHS